jgi:branched-chain amino acid transport system permease protein
VLGTWYLIERTPLAPPCAATERPQLAGAGHHVPVLVTAIYAAGDGHLVGALPRRSQVNPLMGSNLIIVVFAVVVIGGMGSILGSIVTGLALGIVEGLTKVVYPEASGVVIFVIMIAVLLLRPAGLFGKQA